MSQQITINDIWGCLPIVKTLAEDPVAKKKLAVYVYLGNLTNVTFVVSRDGIGIVHNGTSLPEAIQYYNTIHE